MKLILKIISKIFSSTSSFILSGKNSYNIVILSFHFLGDTISTLPAVDLLKKNLPGKNIYIFCYPENETIYKIKYPDLHYKTYSKDYIDLPSKMITLKFFNVLREIILIHPSIIIDITSSFKTSLLSALCGSAERVGFGNSYFEGFFNYFIKTKVDQHVIYYYLDAVENYLHTGELLKFEEVPINFNPKDKIIIIPSAGWKAKEWPFNKYFKLAELLNRNYNLAFVMEGKLVESEIENEMTRKGIRLIKSNSVNDLINILKECSLLISNDTGPILISGLLGKPTFSINGPTNQLFHKLPGNYHKFYQSDLKCTPDNNKKMCFTLGGRIGCPSNECMRILNFNDVFDEVIKFINVLELNPKIRKC